MVSLSIRKIDIKRFLELSEITPVVDVRSPSEFNTGHIPGAVNIPLFNDKERESVGIKYKNEGRIPAILEGLKHTSPVMSSKLEQALKIAKNGKLLVHCWRGGMRSEAMAWLFSLGDIDTEVLDGGYKLYRHHILESLSEKRKMIVLGGLTGSSKTRILKFLKELGQQVIDLEELARHKGSAFGSLGQPPQPSTEQFANILYDEWKHINKDVPFWVEDESRNIGSVFMPERFYLNMQETPAIILMMDIKTRLPRLVEEYSIYPGESLKAAILKISKRLGGDNTRDAINAVGKGDFAKAIEIALYYYDKAYMFGLKKKSKEEIIYVKTDSDDIKTNALKILEALKNIKWT
ncbi:MAG: tRNA 2-selenouridine(34) synthase MnmH [Bacteroidia bacterium]|nr:tRNA 2-selenouridine(34) synthase MnmH [Bacteroidia bacterium]